MRLVASPCLSEAKNIRLKTLNKYKESCHQSKRCRAYFLIQKSVEWTFDTLELPPAQTLMRMAAWAVILFKTSGRLQNKPYGHAFDLPCPVKIQVLLVCRTD